jgi:hypothetical protein
VRLLTPLATALAVSPVDYLVSANGQVIEFTLSKGMKK